VGSAAIQLAKLMHCRVIATAGGDAKMARARELGADLVIDHYREDIAEEVKKFTGRRGVQVVFEHVGEATWPKSLASLGSGARLVTCGATTGFDARVDLRFLFNRQHSLLGSFMGSLGELYQVLEMVFRKQVKPVIDRVYPLAQVEDAHRRLEDKKQFGKVVLSSLNNGFAFAIPLGIWKREARTREVENSGAKEAVAKAHQLGKERAV
jgi:NADPH:quinone reductase-like Zn-dependent oxidoreductase